MEKNEILNSDCAVRRNAAGNPNIPGYTPSDEEFIVTETYVASRVQIIYGTSIITQTLLRFIHTVVSAVLVSN